jgi:FMN phosphatase YigB (HAD superfamily)
MKHIFFDIDRTIFNTDSWYETNRLKVVELFNSKYLTDGISTYEIFIGLLKQRGINKNTNIKKTIVELSQVLKLDEKEFLDDMIDIILTEDYTKLVYDGVFDFLEEIFGKFRVGIFSEVDPWFQNIKLYK